MPEERDETCEATIEPLPGDHELLRHGWRGGVRLTVPRCGGLGEDRFIVRGVVVAATGAPRTVVCHDPGDGPWVPMPDDEAARIRLEHAELLDPYIRTWGPEFNHQEGPESGEED